MSWKFFVGALGLGMAIYVVRAWALISVSKARQHLRQGALIIDARTPEEFERRHLPEAVNLPLAGLPDTLLERIRDRDQVLLLHCAAGGRSAVARRLLRAKGYRRSYNLGSFHRALRIVGAFPSGAQPKPPARL